MKLKGHLAVGVFFTQPSLYNLNTARYKTLLRNNHITRLKEGSCTVETGFIWSDLITNFERVSDHCSNVAVGIIDVSEHTMNAHEVIKSLKAGNAHYSDRYEEYSSKYSVTKLA